MSDLGSVGEGDVVLYDGLVRGEGEVAEVEGGQVLDLPPLARMEQHEELDSLHSDICWRSMSGPVFIFS